MSVELGPNGPTMTFDHEEIHNLSIGVLKMLSATDASVGDSALACLLSTARLLAGKRLEEEEELEFLVASMEWAGAYFATGGEES